MANHKSSKKRILVTEKKNAVNNSRRSGDKAAATAAMRNAESKIMKSAGKVMPKKRAARKISRLTKRVAKMA